MSTILHKAYLETCADGIYSFIFEDNNSEVILEEHGRSEKCLDKLLEAAMHLGIYNIEIYCDSHINNNISEEAKKILGTFNYWEFKVQFK